MAQKKVENVHLDPPTKGMQSNYSHYIASPNSWSYLENFDTDRLGVLKTRTNIFTMGTSASAFQGVGTYEKGGTTNFLLKSGTACFSQQANTFSTGAMVATAITFSQAAALARFDNIQGVTVFAATGDGMRYTADSATASAFASVRLGMPTQVDLVAAGFGGRIWGAISNDDPASFVQDQVYYSDVIPAAGVGSTTGSGQFIKVNTGGKWITGLAQFNNILYVFTADSIFRIYNTQSVDNAPFANIGAIRQECIIKTFDAIYFMHFTGMYKLDGNGITKISQDVDDFIQAKNLLIDSSASNYSRRTFGWFDEQAVYFSIDYDPGFGGFSVDYDRTYVMRYNYLFKTWCVLTIKDFIMQGACSKFFSTNINGFANLINLSPITCIVGQNITTSGYIAGIYDVPSYYDGSKPFQSTNNALPNGDWVDGSGAANSLTRPIYANAETQWLTFGAENRVKTIAGISVAHENAEGFQLLYQIDNEEDQKSDRRNDVWKEIGTLNSDYVTFFQDFISDPFYRIKFKVSGQTAGVPVTVGEISLLIINDEGYGVN